MSNILKKIGKNIKNKRDKKDYAQLDLAFYSGIGHSTIAQIELGRRNVTILSLEKLAVALDTTVQELMK